MPGPTDGPLASWNDTATTEAIVNFVESDAVAPEQRIAVFDNDGTLWCEKPMPIQLDFILRRLVAMAEQNPSLRSRQPWKAAYERDFEWLGGMVVKHYQGDDSDVKLMMVALGQAFGGVSVEDYQSQVLEFFDTAKHPTLGRSYRECAFVPMLELLDYLRDNGYRTYIASGGDRDFMRPIASPVYGIPTQRVIGSSFGLSYEDRDGGGGLIYTSSMDFFDDGPEKPIRIWSRIGERPALAAGNSNGDVPMLRFAGGPGRSALRLLVLHDDSQREFDYTAGAERSLELARAQGWTVISIKDDWAQVFA
ncbi:MAG TPA: HAD family hydrolase [Solirubrobacteraceae bacterium]|jgi:phosphoserine phosphatase